MKQEIIGKTFEEERALYALTDAHVIGCCFCGEADGESALKETRKLKIENCKFSLRYPLWHAKDFLVHDSHFESTSRAPIWYTETATIKHCRIEGVKALRECKDSLIEDSVINSPEFAWKCDGLIMRKCGITSEYLCFDSSNIELSHIKMSGKYSFQYVTNLTVADSEFDTKDAFWHSKNVTVTNSILKGEYLGWFSEDLTLINCHISGTQPLCYCKNLKLINCTTEGADLAFEYSDVCADISGDILSVKNPLSGRISADSIGEIITENSIMEGSCQITVKGEDK